MKSVRLILVIHWNHVYTRTLNDLEDWKYALNKAAVFFHPNIFELIIIFRKEHAKIEDGNSL